MDADQTFFKAIQEGDVEVIQKALANDPGVVSHKTEQGVTPLLLAIYYGQREVVDILLAHTAEVNIFEASALGQTARVSERLDASPRLLDAFADDGFTPLGLASFFGHPDTVEVLLRAGADPDLAARNAMNVRPIHSAVANRDAQIGFEIARMLIEHGAEVNVAQHGGWTPLHQAAAHGQNQIVTLLLQHGADRSATSDDGKTAHQMAVENGHEETQLLLR